VVDWLDERYPFTKAVDEALYQRVPNFANAFYYCFGGMVFILIVFQLLTGVLLALYYVPAAGGNPAPAYTSVQFIQNEVYLGWLIRGVHFWSANLLIVMVLIHMARVYWTGSYRAPRELNWMVGVLMLLIILALSLTGYLLPWDTKAYFATEVTIKIAGSAPPQQLGAFIKEIPPGRAGCRTSDAAALLHPARLRAAGADRAADVRALPLHPRARDLGATVSDKDLTQEGPGAAVVTPPREIEIVELDGHGGHTLEPEWKRLPIGPDHILYPVVVGLALFPILMGDAGHHLADDMPDDETHPFFPDHFWPYPIIAVVMLIAVGLLSAFVQKNLELEASADPRAVTIPRPDWYFLFLFQFLKLGPELIMSLVIPPIVVGALLLFPFIDAIAGPRLARRLGWKRWPVPGRNIITGTIFVAGLVFVAFLTLWALAGPNFCLPYLTGPVCGA